MTAPRRLKELFATAASTPLVPVAESAAGCALVLLGMALAPAISPTPATTVWFDCTAAFSPQTDVPTDAKVTTATALAINASEDVGIADAAATSERVGREIRRGTNMR